MREREFLQLLSARRNELMFNRDLLKPLVYGPDGYNDTPITDDFITDVWLEFSKRTRQEESTEYLKSLAGEI